MTAPGIGAFEEGTGEPWCPTPADEDYRPQDDPDVECPSCGSPDVQADDDGLIECLTCGAEFRQGGVR